VRSPSNSPITSDCEIKLQRLLKRTSSTDASSSSIFMQRQTPLKKFRRHYNLRHLNPSLNNFLRGRLGSILTRPRGS
jgi:hypothetical protein